MARRTDDRRVDLDRDGEGRGVGAEVREQEGEPEEDDEHPSGIPLQHRLEARDQEEVHRHGNKAPELQPVAADALNEVDAEQVSWDGHEDDVHGQERLVPHLVAVPLGLGLDEEASDAALEGPRPVERDVQEEPSHRSPHHRLPEVRQRPAHVRHVLAEGRPHTFNGLLLVGLQEHLGLFHLGAHVDHQSGRHGPQGKQRAPDGLQRHAAREEEEGEHAGEQHAPALHGEDRGDQAPARHGVAALGHDGGGQGVLAADADA
mmetsp:Transcript_104083/g.233660  ORF Transcript_104083/g.233660 Transcript_104083/m.233660 type:complete len:261 (-) Transcript_104083:425-1207(-)